MRFEKDFSVFLNGNVFSLFVLLFSLTLFYGCIGGGGGDDPLVTASQTHITGSVTASGTIAASVKSGILASVSVASATVYLESNPEIKTLTDDSGKFDLFPVPPGNYRVVARLVNSIGQGFKVRSTQFSVQDFANETPIGQLELFHASKTIKGILKDAQGNPVSNGKLVLWGEVFTTDSNGEYETPPMPSDAEGTVSIEVPGFQKTTIEITFAYPTPPLIQITLSKTGETNRAPKVALSAPKYVVSPFETIKLLGVATDPDNDFLTYEWKHTAGTLATYSNGISADWTVPSVGNVATISFLARDPGGLFGSMDIGIAIEGGQT